VAVISSIDLDCDPCVMIGTREIDAPRELVWSVWTDPQHLAQWWGPDEFRTIVTFEALGENRTCVTLRGTFPSAEERARVIREYGADKGLVQTLARLADYAVRQTN
jgi:uncharacterized protein YndB with AHSA1/START domain